VSASASDALRASVKYEVATGVLKCMDKQLHIFGLQTPKRDASVRVTAIDRWLRRRRRRRWMPTAPQMRSCVR